MKLPNISIGGLYAILMILAFSIVGLGYFHIITNSQVENMAEGYIKSRTGLVIELPVQVKP